ncbi:uncharacterized protein [Eurosta solidaginis]|uniref:uncharacterized protein n=1 Tax=Eurosta solidaginis TaxID=178769 RepID=UPI0035314841
MNVDEVVSLTVNGLKNKLRTLGLQTTGQKKELQDRLLQHYGLSRNVSSDNELVYGDVENNNMLPRSFVVNQQQFTLKDLGDCIAPFSGEGSVDIRFWINEFEMNSDIVKWNELQKFVYGKQLLRGAAKLFVRSQTDIKNWEDVKRALISEFGQTLSSSEVHNMLKNRRKYTSETLREYLYNLMEIGKQIHLDEASIIYYFIEGIPDSKFNKSVLYHARNIASLKEQIKVYEKISKPNTNYGRALTNNAAKDNKSGDGKSKEEIGKRCFKCGDKAHLAAQCTKKEFKCFKCNESGHRSFECKGKGSKPIKKEPSSVNTLGDEIFQPFVSSVRDELHFKTIQVDEFKFEALIDSGCSLNLMRYDTLLMSGCKTKLNNDKRRLYTACANVIETIGSFDTFIKVDDLVIDVTFHVVREQDIQFAGMIGKAILKRVDIVLTENEVVFKNKDTAGKPVPEEKQGERREGNVESDINDTSNKWIKEFDVMNLTEIKRTRTLDLEHLNKSMAGKVESLVSDYNPVGKRIAPVKMDIILSDEIPVYQRPRRLTFEDRTFVEKQVEDWLREGIIQPSERVFIQDLSGCQDFLDSD